MSRFVLLIVGVAWMGGAAADDGDALLAKVKPPAQDAPPAVQHFPSHFKGFEKRIKELDGKAILGLIGEEAVIGIQLQEYDHGLGKGKKHLTGADFIHALRTGTILPDAADDWATGKKMPPYDLQGSEACIVQTKKGDYEVGVFYEPVGYIVLLNGECYWFLFGGNKDK